MTPDMSRRCGLALFLALSIAAGAGLVALPTLDPGARGGMPWTGWVPGAALMLSATAGGYFTWHQLARHVHPAWAARALRALAWLTWGIGMSAWLLAAGDGRLLLWLALTPLWLAAAGLWERGTPPSHALRPATEFLPEQGANGGVMDKIDVRGGPNVALTRPGQPGIRGREDDVVPMAVDAEEQLAA